MNLSFPIGIAAALALLIFGIAFTGPQGMSLPALGAFLNLPGLLITVGGTVAALLAAFPPRFLKQVPGHIAIIMGGSKADPLFYVNALTELSREARRKGLLALEESVSVFEDDFLRDSATLIVDAVEPDKIRARLETELDGVESRHTAVWNFYDKGAALAIGFGVIGTLAGLVNMLAGMASGSEGGIAGLAAGMALSLTATLYGVILAHVVFLPVSSRLRVAHEEEMLCKELVIEGIVAIQSGENPGYIREKLLSHLARLQREATSAGVLPELPVE